MTFFRKRLLLSSIFIFSIIYFIAYVTPLNSDDYTYALRSLTFSSIKMHYLGWSGRIVSDTISTSLLNFFPRAIYNAINSFALTIMLLCWTLLPAKMTNTRPSPYVMALLFILYFVANHALGQTTFWLVGAANYLWTNMFISIFFLFSVHVAKEKISGWINISYLFSAFCAGCSNENTAPIVAGLSLCYFLVNKRKVVLLIGFCGATLGAMVLLLAPGNIARATTAQDWYNQPFLSRATLHFTERLPDAMGAYWQVYIALIFLLIAASLSSKGPNNNLLPCFIFVVCAFAANAAFVASPGMPERAWNGAFCFLLLAVAFAAHQALLAKENISRCIYFLTFAIVFIYFIPSYGLYYSSINSIKNQSHIRDNIIHKAIAQGEPEANIPDYYFPPVMHKGPSLDTFNSESMSRYYGIKVNVHSAGFFDYSKAYTTPAIQVNAKITNDLYIKSFWVYKEQLGSKTYILYEFSANPAKILAGNTALFVHLYKKDGSMMAVDVEKNSIDVDGRWFSGRTIQSISKHDIETISTGTWNVDTKKIINEYTTAFD